MKKMYRFGIDLEVPDECRIRSFVFVRHDPTLITLYTSFFCKKVKIEFDKIFFDLLSMFFIIICQYFIYFIFDKISSNMFGIEKK